MLAPVARLLHAVRNKASTLRTAVWTAQDQDTDQINGANVIRRNALLILDARDLSTAQTLAKVILAEAIDLKAREDQDVSNHSLIESCAQALIDALEALPKEDTPREEPPGTPVPVPAAPHLAA